jgi:hypothetical protein
MWTVARVQDTDVVHDGAGGKWLATGSLNHSERNSFRQEPRSQILHELLHLGQSPAKPKQRVRRSGILCALPLTQQ